MTRIAEITARAEAATTGPWICEQSTVTGRVKYCIRHTNGLVVGIDGGLKKNNADFIAHARQDIPFLLALIQQVTKERDAYKRVKDYWGSLYGQGLEVANWYLNGDTEPFDEFWESAEEEFNNEPGKGDGHAE